MLLADGAPIADGPAAEVLAGGTLLRDRDGPDPRRRWTGALTPERSGVAALDPRRRASRRVAGMSWQLAAFPILALALAAGFAWYERTRPDARIVALVATLAAFAALGRIAFAAVPNVKPTTDIVLISGYALGGAPGFVVGAIAGLTSNFFFGQGPWTPWQMAAWGATGLHRRGARGHHAPADRPLAAGDRVRRSRLLRSRRFRTSATGSPTATTASAQLGVYVGKGLGFDADPRRGLRAVRARVRTGADALDPAVRAPTRGPVGAGAGAAAVRRTRR